MPSLITDHPSVGPLLTERVQRAKLLDGMVRAVAEKGFASATVADAVRLARVSRGTFYELFESKEACLAAAYRLGCEVLEQRVSDAVREAVDWRDELRLGIRTYLHTLEEEPVFARVYLLEWPAVGGERDAALRRFAARYGKTFARSGRPVPPDDALFVLAVGIHELACSRVRAGRKVVDLEDTLVGCAVRLVAKKEDAWT
ncbi:MAG: TetR/AcrR family transcriptional regulator [Solirubrobacteraceae bacterium]